MRLKWIVPSPTRMRPIKLRLIGKRDRLLLGYVVERTGYERARYVPTIWDRNSEDNKSGALLIKELEETNNWARLVLKLYFGWFALQFTVNGFAMGWLFTYRGPMPWFASLVFLVFIGWNLMGTIGAVMFYKSLVEGDLRIQEVIETMVELHLYEGDFRPTPRSLMPRRPISIVFGFCVVTTFMSLAFWIVLFVTGR
jgi:hypothetical protein